MQISSRFTIGLHILTAIDMFQKDYKVTSDFLAGSIRTNPVVVRKILGQLKKAGLIHSSQGVAGITMAKPLEEISFYDVYSAIEPVEDGDLFRFHDDPNPDCPVGRNIHELLDGKLREIQSAMEEKMRGYTLADLHDGLEELLQKANEDARDILAKAKEEADQAISDLRKASQGGKKGGDLSSMERTRTALRNKVNEKNASVKFKKEPAAPAGKKLRASDLHIGDKVKVVSMGLTGTVSALPDRNGKVSVRCGILQSKVDLSDLRLLAEDAFGNTLDAYGNPIGGSGSGKRSGSAIKRAFKDADRASSSGKDMDLSRGSSVSPELNLLGLTTDDAIWKLDKYLDEARVSHLQSVRIVHGKGTGALRKAVHEYLRRQKWIKSYRIGDFGEGDAGVTIVTLRN